jgi:K+-transporting ATPase ATPase C chain
MLAHLRPAFVILGLFTGLTGIVYPLAMTGIAQILLPERSNGSMIRQGNRIVGSTLIGQQFKGEAYFHGRPSAAGDGYNAAASSGSNLGPVSKKLLDRVAADAEAIRLLAGGKPIPADAVTASASGLDPHISPAYAELQVPRVAAARSAAESKVRDILARAIENPAAGLIGEPRVNVLLLNLALDAELAGRSG